jgi:thiamine-monophosphate kinase
MYVEGRHFRSEWLSSYDIARRSAAASAADIVAMGARPTAVVVGLAMPQTTPLDWVDGLADGLRDEAALCGARVVGGDLVAADVVTITVTVLGDLAGRDAVTRSGATPGDVVAVVGRLGWSAAGLRLLLSGEMDGALQDAFRRPAPPYTSGPFLADAGASAMIDVSDGLAVDLGHIALRSGVRIDLDTGALRALGAAGVTDEELLTGGEDHALACTIRADAEVSDEAVIIGRVSEGSGVYADGAPISGGHDHFRR